jgi:hypothetical protein
MGKCYASKWDRIIARAATSRSGRCVRDASPHVGPRRCDEEN